MRTIKHGATDQSTVIRIIDATDGSPEQAVEHDTGGISLWYRREGGSVTAITPAALAAANSAHADGGIEHLDDGYYRLDLPDAACATGAAGVLVGGAVTGMIVQAAYHPLSAFVLDDGATAADVRAEMDSNSTQLAKLGTPAGASISADIAAVKAQTAAIETDTQDLQARTPAALVGGRMDASVGAMAANVMTAAAAAADLTTELQSGLATAASIAALNNLSQAQAQTAAEAALTAFGAIQ
jgi:hypothetical protein